MNIKTELVNTFKNLLGVYFGKIYSYSELKISDKSIGGKVEKINADGSLSELEDGEFVMDDGFTFTVKGGLIESINGEQPIDAKEQPTGSTSGSTECAVSGSTIVEPVVEDNTPSIEEKISEMENEISELKNQIESILSEKMNSEKSIEQFNSIVKELNDNIKTLAKVPVEFSKTNNKPVVEESKEEKLFNVAKLIGGITKNK